jgi:ABC-2 type transport system ATP-binding protein
MRDDIPTETDISGVPVIEVTEVRKKFGSIVAVDGISFTVMAGEIFGFLGPNGAGKTTTINLLTGLARPDSGAIRIAGIDCLTSIRAAKSLFGVVPDENNLYPEMTGFENLCFCASLYGISRSIREAKARELLKVFGLADVGERKFAGYSRGMKRKLTIAAGLIHEPQILFLDEPTTGIDVTSARQIRQLISELCRRGTTVFLTTHYIEEAERLCDRIAFIVAGRIVRIDKVSELLKPVAGKHVIQITYTGSVSDLPDILRSRYPELEYYRESDNAIRVESYKTIHTGKLVRTLEELGLEVIEARKISPSLEDVFVRLTGIESSIMHKEKEKS